MRWREEFTCQGELTRLPASQHYSIASGNLKGTKVFVFGGVLLREMLLLTIPYYIQTILYWIFSLSHIYLSHLIPPLNYLCLIKKFSAF